MVASRSTYISSGNALTVKTSTGIKSVQDEKQLGAQFNQLFPQVQTRGSRNPDMAVESSFLQLSTDNISSP